MKRITLEMQDNTKALVITSLVGDTEILLSQQTLDSKDLTDGNTVEITISESKKQEGN